jgi:hypothetical protein
VLGLAAEVLSGVLSPKSRSQRMPLSSWRAMPTGWWGRGRAAETKTGWRGGGRVWGALFLGEASNLAWMSFMKESAESNRGDGVLGGLTTGIFSSGL